MQLFSRYHRVSDKMYAPNSAERFAYSGGKNFEDYIADAVANSSDLSVMSGELEARINNWASLYHLGYRRSFLLRPAEHLLRGCSVLELGAGCGALTRYFGETAQTVAALEGSPRRAAIAVSRGRDLANVFVINDTIQ